MSEALFGPQRQRPLWFVCRGCFGLPDAPMLKHEVWKSVSEQYGPYKGHDLLCTACIERALGRHIGIDDLLDCLGNEFVKLYASRQESKHE